MPHAPGLIAIAAWTLQSSLATDCASPYNLRFHAPQCCQCVGFGVVRAFRGVPPVRTRRFARNASWGIIRADHEHMKATT